ncbi:MAG: hypothetical protein ABSA14_06275 [Acidimicrobiales bacterium]|jgi:hypothetical protein
MTDRRGGEDALTRLICTSPRDSIAQQAAAKKPISTLARRVGVDQLDLPVRGLFRSEIIAAAFCPKPPVEAEIARSQARITSVL